LSKTLSSLLADVNNNTKYFLPNMRSEVFVSPPKEEIRKKYSELKNSYSQLINEARYILEKALEKTQIKINNIEYRVKDFDSFYENCGKRCFNTSGQSI
jgi:cell fate (sporulation/competence/biofilm development) regulator YmcA (YheA/YmcA/DUF963 family)